MLPNIRAYTRDLTTTHLGPGHVTQGMVSRDLHVIASRPIKPCQALYSVGGVLYWLSLTPKINTKISHFYISHFYISHFYIFTFLYILHIFMSCRLCVFYTCLLVYVSPVSPMCLLCVSYVRRLCVSYVYPMCLLSCGRT